VSYKTSGTRYNTRILLYLILIFGIQRIVQQQMTLLEAQKLTLRVLKQVMEEKLDHHNVQLAQARTYSLLSQIFITNFITGHTTERVWDIRRSTAEGNY